MTTIGIFLRNNRCEDLVFFDKGTFKFHDNKINGTWYMKDKQLSLVTNEKVDTYYFNYHDCFKNICNDVCLKFDDLEIFGVTSSNTNTQKINLFKSRFI